MSAPPSMDSSEALPAADAQWFNDEVYAHDGQLKAHLRGSFPSIRDVEDVVQDSYVRIWQARAGKPISSAKSFLFTIARRLALNVVRRNSRSPFVSVTDLDQICSLEETTAAGQASDKEYEVKLLSAAIDSLPARCREVFVMRRIHGVPPAEIAKRLGLSIDTVNSQIAKGLRRCQAYMLEHMKP